MALEFALRPRINLERPTPSRRRRRSPRFALLVVAYWLAIAGGAAALLRVLKSSPGEALAEAAEPSLAVAASDDPTPGPEEAAPEPAPAESAAVPEPADAPEPALAASPEPTPAPEPSSLLAARGMAPPDETASHAEPATPSEPASSHSEPHARERPRSTELLARESTQRAEPRTLQHSVPAEPRAPKHAELPPPLEAFEPSSSEAPARVPRDEQVRRDTAPTSLPSCEAAAASASETLDIGGGARAPDLPREAFAAVLDNGAYLARCALPARTTVEICAAVRDGKVVGVSASTTPRDSALNACVRRAVAGLRFPKSPHLDVTRTRFDQAR